MAGKTSKEDTNNSSSDEMTTEESEQPPGSDSNNDKYALSSGTFWLTRICFLRSLAFIYTVAFLVALDQNQGLLGSNGLLPADQFMTRVDNYVQHNKMDAFKYVPTLFWFMDWKNNIDQLMYYVSLCGLTLSSIVLVTGASNMVIMFILWVLYHTIVNIGQRWYSFGWESQLLETGFLAIFLCPLYSMNSVCRGSPPSRVVIWGYRWLIFRIMLGAGLIKIRGDQCWRDLTCMNYHYQTQPVPNPISYYLHQLPEWWHHVEVMGNHFVELVAPFLTIFGRFGNMANGTVQILFQIILIISGNLSFLNWLTILPSICCFDDKFLQPLFTARRISQIRQIQGEEERRKPNRAPLGRYVRRVMNMSLAALLAYLSIPVVQNLLSSRQAMNTSFEPLRIVNTYGAFGSITKRRTEIILEGTSSEDPRRGGGSEWLEYEFKCKPGNVTTRPCLISPYHYRLDWLMWFAAFQSAEHNSWFLHLVGKLLTNDNHTTHLIKHNPFAGGDPPRWVRAVHYKYAYTKLGSAEATRGDWYKRKALPSSLYLEPHSLRTIQPLLASHGWTVRDHLPKHARRYHDKAKTNHKHQ